jgi:hypothetical protein
MNNIRTDRRPINTLEVVARNRKLACRPRICSLLTKIKSVVATADSYNKGCCTTEEKKYKLFDTDFLKFVMPPSRPSTVLFLTAGCLWIASAAAQQDSKIIKVFGLL